MHRATVSASKAASSRSTPTSANSQQATNALTRSCFKNLMKEARYFDSQPLAKALLSASPFLRKDPCWASLVHQTKTTPSKSAGSSSSSSATKTEIVRPAHGLTANTLAVPTTPDSLKDFVRAEFRKPATGPFNHQRYFECMRRLQLAKKLHVDCAEETAPALPAVVPNLKPTDFTRPQAPAASPKKKAAKTKKSAKATTPAAASVSNLQPGTMLLAHPVLVDDFTQAAVLVTSVSVDEGVTGLTMNVPYVPLKMVMEGSEDAVSTLRQRFPEMFSKSLKAENKAFFNEWTVYSGGSIACAPLIVHKCDSVAKGIVNLNKSMQGKTGSGKKSSKKIVDVDPSYAVKLPNGWWIHALTDVMLLEPSLVKNSLEMDVNARIVMNYSGWSEEQLLEEVCQNWWLQADASSSCGALQSLMTPVKDVAAPTSSAENATSSTAASSSASPSSTLVDTVTDSDLEAAIAAARKSAKRIEGKQDDDDQCNSHLNYGSPSNYMWQRAVSNLGVDLKDFARLKVVEEEEGDYRRKITSTFKDDLPSPVRASATANAESDFDEAQEE